MHKHLHSCVHQHALRGLARAHAQVSPTGSHAALHPDACNKNARMAPCTSTSTAACIASASKDLHEHMHRCSHGFCMLLHAPMHAWLRAQAQLCASRLHAEISADAGKSLLAEPCTGAGRVACAAPVQLPKAAFPPAGIECPRGARNLPGMVQEGEPFSEEATQFTKELVLQREVGTAACRVAERCRAPGRGWGGQGGGVCFFVALGFEGGRGDAKQLRGLQEGVRGCSAAGRSKGGLQLVLGGCIEGCTQQVHNGCIKGCTMVASKDAQQVQSGCIKDAQQMHDGCIKDAGWLHQRMQAAGAEWLHYRMQSGRIKVAQSRCRVVALKAAQSRCTVVALRRCSRCTVAALKDA